MPEFNTIQEIHTRLENDEDLDESKVDEFKEFVSDHYYELSYGPQSFRLNSLYAKSFQNISDRSVFFGGKNKIIHGQNSQGKTSFLKALQFNLLGLPDAKQDHRMTNLIRDNTNRLKTRGEWLIDDSPIIIDRQMVREGRGGALKEHDQPTISEPSSQGTQPPEEQDIPRDKHNQPHEVFEKIGILPLVNRDYAPYELMSLFIMMPHDFLHFLNWKKSAEVIDIMFGIYLTNVVSAIEDKQEEANITSAMAGAPSSLDQCERELDNCRDDLEELKRKKRTIQAEATDKTDALESITSGSDIEEKLNQLRSQKSRLESKLADLKTERSEKVSELGETERKIRRYEDSELVEDMGGMGNELKSLMTVPDKCPVCTNRVDGSQRERFLDHQECPLCSKDVDSALIEIEKEYQPDESLFERRQEEKEELEDLHSERDEIEFEIQYLDERIESTSDEIDELNAEIEDRDLDGVIQRKERLEREITELRGRAVDIEVEIERKETRLEDLKYELKANSHLASLLEERRSHEEALKDLKQIVVSVRRDERRDLKSRLRDEIQDNLLPKFEFGLFADARGVRFENEDDYQFTLHAPAQLFKSSRTESEAAEATLHALLFHSAIFNLLDEETNAPPIDMIVIDSPMTNDMDANNQKDVVNLITSLPEYLANYQIIISMAESDDDIMEELEKTTIPMEQFRKDIESEEGEKSAEFADSDKGVA